MTALSQRVEPVAAADDTRAAHRVLVGVIAADVLIGVRVDAVAPVGMQISALVDLVNARLGEVGAPRLTPAADLTRRGRWALCWVDGSGLRTNRSLADQGVVDGTRLWLRFLDDTESRVPVIEHVTSAIPAELSKHWQPVRPRWAAQVGVTMVAAAVAATLGLLIAWRHAHPGWIPAAVAATAAVLVLGAAAVAGLRAGPIRRLITDVLTLTGAGAAAVAAGLAVPGPLGAPHTALGAAVLLAAAVLIVRFTGRHAALGTAVIVLAGTVLVTGALRMLLMTSAVTLLTCVLLAVVVGLKATPSLARQAGRIRLPVFPSASGRWIFETRPDLPSAVVVAGGEHPQLEGPESVRDVAVATDRAHATITGLLSGFGVLLVICGVWLCDPRMDRRWLPLVLTGVLAGAVLLHARSYTDRRQSTILAAAAVATAVAVPLRYAVGLDTLPALLVACAVMLLVPGAGLVAAVVVPNTIYNPLLRQLVEWAEYVLLLAVFPLGFWLMDVFAAIRYR
ncbi:type VII secretion integral membrane protein EccD [Mycolicibacterium sp. BK634]|uniref:type VII secretion integral membrane protein EccD n=1 Tax=Mycolicibacterium sp. BK634 TaxID=2587099 RepID=UPI0017925887|nr:type VII secretion integral membrane protein EccD [Mycolicibacterium sp. BK634]